MTVVGDVLRITANFSQGGDEYVNVHHFQVAAITGTPSDQTIMDDIADYLDTSYAAIIGQQVVGLLYEDISGQNITQNVIMPTVAWPVLTAGTGSGEAVPKQTAGYVFWRTLRPKTRASSFIPGFSEISSNAGLLIAGAVGSLENFGDRFVGGMGIGSATLLKGAYNYPLDRFTVVTSRHVSPTLATQRRRRLGVGA